MTDSSVSMRYRLVQRSVRPPRAVTFVCTEGDWRADIHHMLACYSRTWGGDGSGLVASSSTWDVAEPFWSLLTELDPDHWAIFRRTHRGLRISDPAAYEVQLSTDATAWARAHGGTEAEARQVFETERFLSDARPGLTSSAHDERIRHRFAPLASETVVVRATYKADEPPPPGLVDMCQLTFQPPRSVEIDTTSLPQEIQLLVKGRIGHLAPGHVTHLEETSDFDRTLVSVGPDELSRLLEFAWTGQVDMTFMRLRHTLSGGDGDPIEPAFGVPDFLTNTPLAQSRLGCSWYTKMRPELDQEPIVVVCGDTAEDFCYSFTRQRVVGNTYWLPVTPGDTGDIGRVLRETMTRMLSRYAVAPTGNRPILLTSLTLGVPQLEEVLAELLTTTWGRDGNAEHHGVLTMQTCEPAELPIRRNLVLLDDVHFADSLYEPFLGAELARNLEIPLPSEAKGHRPESCRWQVDVEVTDNVLPARWSLHPTLTVGSGSLRWAVRSSKSGVSVDSHGRGFMFEGSNLSQMLVQVRLRAPGATEIFTTLLAKAGVTLEESDKGRYTRRMVELWGGLPALADDLRDGPARSLLTSWVNYKKDSGIWHIQDRNYLRLDDVSRTTGLDAGEARQLLDRYQHLCIATRGLVLRCRLCAGTSFYRLEDLGPGFRCGRCRQANEIARAAWKGKDEPDWFYALDEVAYQGLASNIHVPILALAELSKSASSFLHMPEAIVHRPDDNDIEVDIWAIVDGRIVLGEAKLSDRLEPTAKLEQRRCGALRTLVDDLAVDEFVMATAGSAWSARTTNSVENVIGPRTNISWLTDLS